MARPRFFTLLVVLALIASACGGSGTADTTVAPTTTSTLNRPATTVPADPSVDPATAAIEARIDELMIEAQQIRGLEFLEPVEVLLLADADYQARFIDIIDEEISEEDIQAINALLRVLGIIRPDDDYKKLIETLLSAGTGGFYDPETGELVVRLVGDDFGPYSESVVIHELVHALQDQHFELLDREDLEGDASYVATAIIEGDALLRELTYTQSLGLADQAAYFAQIATIDLSALDTLPGYILESFQAAYLDGFFFHQEIGLDEIDARFTDLPESSEQLLDPEKYRRDEQPRPVTLPEFDLPGYEIWFDAPAGQKDLELLLTDGIGPNQAAAAAAGWGGDMNRVYNAGEDEAVYVLSYLGDTKTDAAELEAAFTVYIDAMVPDDTFTLVERDEDAVLVIIASDPTVGPTLQAAFAG